MEKYLPLFFSSTVGQNHNSLNEQVFVKSNRCEKRLKNCETMLPGFVGVLDFIDNSRDQLERRSRPGFPSKLSDSSVPRVSNLCDAPHVEIDEPQDDFLIDLDFVNLLDPDSGPQIEPSLSPSSFIPIVIFNYVSSLPALMNVSRLYFVTEGPGYTCLFSDHHVCTCINLKHKEAVRFEAKNKSSNSLLEGSSLVEVLITFALSVLLSFF